MAATHVEAEVEVVQVEHMDIVNTNTVLDPEKANYKEIKIGEAVKFECYICHKRFPKVVGVKGHIRKVHEKKEASEIPKKRKNAADFFEGEDDAEKRQRLEDDEEGVEKFLKDIATYWDDSEEPNREDVESNDKNENISQFPFSQSFSTPASQDIPEINTIEEAKALVDSMKQEVEVAKANAVEDKVKIESLENALKTKDDIINVSKATINSLEIDKISRTNAVIECKNIFEDQRRKIAELEKKCSNNKQDDNQTKTLKKAETDIRKLKKDMDEKDKRIKEVLVKLNKETERRSKAKADVVRVSKVNHSMTKLLEKKDEREKKEDKKKREK